MQSNWYHQNALSVVAASSTDSAASDCDDSKPGAAAVSLLRQVTFRQPTGIAAVARREEKGSALKGGILAGIFLRKHAFQKCHNLIDFALCNQLPPGFLPAAFKTQV